MHRLRSLRGGSRRTGEAAHQTTGQGDIHGTVSSAAILRGVDTLVILMPPL